MLAEGERDLSRIVARADALGSAPSLEQTTSVLDGTELTVPKAVARGAHRALVVDSVLGACRSETDLVVELGAGWGRNLFLVWLNSGPPAARYVAAEVTASGRQAAALLAGQCDGPDLAAVPFDFDRPSAVSEPTAQHAVVFTCHGIGQVPTLDPAVFEVMRGLGRTVAGVHVEPVGWQLAPSSELSDRSRRYAERNDYNRNFIEVLTAEEARGRITVERALPNCVGENPEHSSSLVVWRKV